MEDNFIKHYIYGTFLSSVVKYFGRGENVRKGQMDVHKTSEIKISDKCVRCYLRPYSPLSSWG